MTVQFVKLLTRLLEPHLKQVCLLAKLLAVQPRHTQSPGRISRLSSAGFVSATLVRSHFFGFSKSAPTPRYTILDSRLPPCNAISEGRLPLCNTSSEAGALPSEVRFENDSDRKFSKSIFFQSFSGNHFSPRFMVRCSLLAENIFRFFEVRTYPSIH